jgi:hypothetical protein
VHATGPVRARLAVAAAAIAVAALPAPASAAVPPARQISVDPIVAGPGQHETAVEPDSISFGNTVVAAFQIGRWPTGGASGIGWATSTDGGASWTSGVLPGLTAQSPSSGPYSRASDPAVAYDRVHGVFLANVLSLRESGSVDPFTSLVVSRSTDGLAWSAPIVVAPDEGRFAHDKNWIACDNGTASPNAGRCYVAWAGEGPALTLAASSDGGLTWTTPAAFGAARGSGWQPLVRPDGTLVIVYETDTGVAAVSSRDGGASFSAPVAVSSLRAARVPGMRAFALPSAEIDAAGTIYVAWHDCRFRPGCPTGAGARNDLVFTSSPDGRSWARTRRVPTGPALEGLTHFLPGLAVDASTTGPATRLALAFSVLTPRGCTEQNCLLQSYFVSSSTGGATWSAPEALASAQPVTAYPPTSGGRFLGDYISTSFVAGGIAVPVFGAATAPFDGRFHQGVFATAIAPLAQRPLPLTVGAPRVARSRTRVSVAAPVTGSVDGASLACRATGTRVRLQLVARRVDGRRVVCTWVVRKAPRGARVSGSITITIPETEVTRRFTFRVR